jgi:hypothetical protein
MPMTQEFKERLIAIGCAARCLSPEDAASAVAEHRGRTSVA